MPMAVGRAAPRRPAPAPVRRPDAPARHGSGPPRRHTPIERAAESRRHSSAVPGYLAHGPLSVARREAEAPEPQPQPQLDSTHSAEATEEHGRDALAEPQLDQQMDRQLDRQMDQQMDQGMDQALEPGGAGEGRAGLSTARAGVPGAGGDTGPGLGGVFGGEWAVYTPPPLPPVERGPASLQQRPLRVPDGAPAFTAPLYLRHRARQKAESLEPAFADYAERFASASSAAFKVYDQVLGRMRSLNSQARSGEDRRAGARQRALDTVLDGLARDFDRARDILAEARSRQRTSLAMAVMATRERIRTTASNGVGSLNWRARKVDRDLAPLHGREAGIIAKPTAKAAELENARVQAESSLDELVTGASTEFSGPVGELGAAMSDAANEALIRDINLPVAEAKSAMSRTAEGMRTGLEGQVGPLTSSLCQSFCPFDALKTMLGTDGAAAVWQAKASSDQRLREEAQNAEMNLDRAFGDAEQALVDQHNQMRERLIEGARQRDQAERLQAEQQAVRGAATLGAVAGAQSRAVTAIDEMIARRSDDKEEDFARSVISFSDGLAAGGVAAARRQGQQAAGGIESGLARADGTSAAGNDRFVDGAAQSAAQLVALANQTGRSTEAMVAGVAENMGKLADPIRTTVTGFLQRANTQFASARASLVQTLDQTASQVEDGFAGVSRLIEAQRETLAPAAPAARPGAPAPPPAAAEPGPCQSGCQAADSAAAPAQPGAAPGAPARPGAAPAGPAGEGGAPGPPAGPGNRGPQPVNDFIADLNGIWIEPRQETNVSGFISTTPTIVAADLSTRATRLGGLLSYGGSEPASVLDQLRGITRKQGRAIEEAYEGNLREDLDWYLNAGNAFSGITTRVEAIRAARAYLNGNVELGAVHELRVATEWSNDSAHIDRIMQGLTPDQMRNMQASYPDAIREIRDDLNQLDGEVFDALADCRVGDAEALRLRERVRTARDTRGNAGADAAGDAISQASSAAGTSRLSGAAQFAELEGATARGERHEREWNSVLSGVARLQGVTEDSNTRGSALIALATEQRDYEVYVPNEHGGGMDGRHGGGGHYETRSEGISAAQERLIRNLVTRGEGSLEARAARLAVELGRPGGANEERVRKATDDPDLNPALARTPEAHAAAIERRDRMYALADEWAPAAEPFIGPRRPEDIRAQIAERLAGSVSSSDPRRREYMRSLVTGSADNPESVIARIDYAVEGAGTSVDVLRSTLGTLTREQFETVRERYDADHDPDLLTRLGIRGHQSFWQSETSGDTANELEVLSIGVPRNDRERAEVAALQMRQQIRDAGVLGPAVAGEEFRQLNDDYRRLMLIMGADGVGFDEHGNFTALDASGQPTKLGRFDAAGNFRPPPGFSATDLAVAMAVGPISAENYKAATDRVADGIATALVVTAAIVTTALTGGAAASIWIPVLVTAAAGVAGVVAKIAIKGGRYGSEEMMFDIASTIIQAATAGIGAAAGAALRGGGRAVGALSRSWRMSEQALATAAAGGTTAATKALPALTLGQELFVGALSSGFAGGANAAINPDAWRGDNYASDIIHGILRGSVSGALGAGVTRGVVGGITNASRGIGARMGASRALAGGATLGQAQGAAARTSQLFGTSALTEVGGRAVGSAASAAVSRAGEIGYDEMMLGRHMEAGQFWNELGSAAGQAFIQGIGEGVADRAIRSRSRSRMAEHEFTTRDDVEDYRRRGTEATIAEGRRRGMIPPAAAEPAAAPARTPAPAPAPAAEPEAVHPAARPTMGVDEEGGIVPIRPLADDEAAPLLPPRAANDDEPVVARSLEDNEDEPVRGPVKIPPAPVRVELDSTNMLNMGAIEDGAVFIHPRADDLDAANDNYRMLTQADPSREAAIYRNAETGEFVVIQGSAHRVMTIDHQGHLRVRGVREGVPLARGAGRGLGRGPWVMEAHYHPTTPGNASSAFLARFPTGTRGDVNVVIRESTDHGIGNRPSRIDFIDNGRMNYSTFAFDPASRAVTIDYPDPITGARVKRTFSSPEAYDSEIVTIRARAAELREGAPALGRDSSGTRLTEGDAFQARRLGEAALSGQAHQEAIAALQARGASADAIAAFQAEVAAADSANRTVVRDLGLVGEPDSMARLQLIMNDTSLEAPMRQAIADTVLAATREHMIAAGQLGPNEPLMLLFHGAPLARAASLHQDGAQMSKVTGGAQDDFGRGLYLTSRVAAADIYAAKFGQERGEIFPFVLRGRDLGTVVDVSPGGAHRAEWEAFVMANLKRFGSAMPVPGAVIDPRAFAAGQRPFGTMNAFGNRGTVFEAFLVHLAAKTGDTRLAAPDAVLGELGGPMTSGVGGRGDQQAIRSQAVMDEMNRQIGFRQRGSDPDEGGGSAPRARQAADEDSDVVEARSLNADDPADPLKLPPAPAGMKPAHEDQALARIAGSRGGAEIVDSIRALAALDRPAVMAVLHAATDAEARTALDLFRKRLEADGMSPQQAAIRARRLDFARASLGGRFRTEADFAAGRAPPASGNLNQKLTDWISQSAVLHYVHSQNPDLFIILHDRFVAAKAGQGGRNRPANFERFVIKALARVDPDLFARAGVRSRDEAVLRMLDDRHQIEGANLPGPKATPASQSGPVITDAGTVAVGTRVDHDVHGRGTVVAVTKTGSVRIHFDDPAAPRPLIPIADGEVRSAREPNPDFDPVPPAHRTDAEMQAQFKQIEDHREAGDLPVYSHGDGSTGTVARIEIGGVAFHGTNSGLDPANFALTVPSRRALFERLAQAFGLKSDNLGQAKFLSHAEAEAMIRAYIHFGALPEVVELFVDRPTCPSCNKDLIRLARMLGVKELRLYYRGQSDPPLVRR
ncbi:MAG TPA: hypothetical protein VFP12_04985 [Allosphingosinicella sp.]|nr:hypothetical protein [Allosphingosinicella sp.]